MQEDEAQAEHDHKLDECTFCQKTFKHNSIRFCCVQCGNVVLCPDCYISRIRYKQHIPEHQFYAKSDYDFPIWNDGFTLHDDLTLLEGIQVCGHGNWQEIHDYMLRPTQEPVELLIKHFNLIYTQNGLLEQMDSRGENITIKEIKSLREFSETQKKSEQSDNTILSDVELNKYLDDYVQFSGQQTKNTQFISDIKQQRLNILRYQTYQVLPPFLEYFELPKDTGAADGVLYVKGTWPRRQEFNFEAGNKVEYPIMYLTVKHGMETRQSMNYKIQILQGYAHRILSRYNLKKAFFQMGLHRNDRKIDEVVLKADGIAVKLNLTEQIAFPPRHQKQIQEYREYRIAEIKIKESRQKDKETEENDEAKQRDEEKQNAQPSTSQAINTQQQSTINQLKQQIKCPQFNFKPIDLTTVKNGITIVGKLTRLVNNQGNNNFIERSVETSEQYYAQLDKYSDFPNLPILQKIENDQQFIIRGISNRYQTRKHIYQQMSERQLRQEIYLLQIARCMGIKQYYDAIYSEIIAFIKNPIPDHVFQLNCIPPGVFAHNKIKQTHFLGIDPILKQNTDLRDNIPRHIIESTSQYLNAVNDYRNGDLLKIFGHDDQSTKQQDLDQITKLIQFKDYKFNNPCISAYLVEYRKKQNNLCSNILQNYNIYEQELYNNMKASDLLTMIIQQNIAQEQLIQHTISCHACMAWEVVELILATYIGLAASISFGLSYKEAVLQGQGTALSINHIYLSHYVCQRVYEYYFGVIAEGSPATIQNGSGNVGSSIYAYLHQLFHQLNTKQDSMPSAEQVYTGYLLSQDFFEQCRIQLDDASIKDYQTYSHTYQLCNPLIKELFDVQLIKNQYIRPTQNIIQLLSILKYSKFCNYRQYLEFIPTMIAAIGMNCPLSSPLKNELTLKHVQIRVPDIFAYNYQSFQKEMDEAVTLYYGQTPEAENIRSTRTLQNYLKTLIAQYQMQNGLITCSSHLFYQMSQAIFIGKNTSQQYGLYNLDNDDDLSNDSSSSEDDDERTIPVTKQNDNINLQQIELQNVKGSSNQNYYINLLQLASVKQVSYLKYMPFISFMDKPLLKKREKAIASAIRSSNEKQSGSTTQQQCIVMSDSLIQLCISFFEKLYNALKPCIDQLERQISDLDNNKHKLTDINQDNAPTNNPSTYQLTNLNSEGPDTSQSARTNAKRDMDINTIVNECTKPFQQQLIQLSEQIKKLNIFKKGYQNAQQIGQQQSDFCNLKQLNEQELQDPVARMFGPQIQPLDQNLTNFQLSEFQISRPDLRIIRGAEKLILDENEIKNSAGKQREEEIVIQLLKRHTSFIDILIVTILQLDIHTYLITKLNYMYNGVINIKMLAAMDNRPGLAEFLALYIDTYDIPNIDEDKLHYRRNVNYPKSSKTKTAWQMNSSVLNPDGQQNVIQNTYDKQPWYLHTSYNLFNKKTGNKLTSQKLSQPKMLQSPVLPQPTDDVQQNQAPNTVISNIDEKKEGRNENTIEDGPQIKFNVIFSYMGKPIKMYDNLTLEKHNQLKKNTIVNEMVIDYNLRANAGTTLDPQTIRTLIDKLKYIFVNSKFMNGYRGITNQQFHSVSKIQSQYTQYSNVQDSSSITLHRSQPFSSINSNIQNQSESLKSDQTKQVEHLVVVRNIHVQTDESYLQMLKNTKNYDRYRQKQMQHIHKRYQQEIDDIRAEIKQKHLEYKQQLSLLQNLKEQNQQQNPQHVQIQLQQNNVFPQQDLAISDLSIYNVRSNNLINNQPFNQINLPPPLQYPPIQTTNKQSFLQEKHVGRQSKKQIVSNYIIDNNTSPIDTNFPKLLPDDKRHQSNIFQLFPKKQ